MIGFKATLITILDVHLICSSSSSVANDHHADDDAGVINAGTIYALHFKEKYTTFTLAIKI
jgi:hypothetical protein